MQQQSAHSHVKKESGVGKGVITGAMTIAEMLTGGLFMENLKMQKQLLAKPYPEVARVMLRGGLSGFWAGFWPWGTYIYIYILINIFLYMNLCIIYVMWGIYSNIYVNITTGAVLGITKGIVLGSSKAIYQNKLLDMGYFSPKNVDLIAGGLAGGTQGAFMGPLLLARLWVLQGMKERLEAGYKPAGLMSEFSISMSILNNAITKRGISVLFIGMPTMIVKRTFDWGSRFLVMGIFKEHILNWKQEYYDDNTITLGFWDGLLCTFMGSGCSILVVQPLDKIVPIIQSQKNDGSTVTSILKEQIHKQGFFKPLWGGMGIRFIHIGWHTSWAIFVSQIVFDKLYPK